MAELPPKLRRGTRSMRQWADDWRDYLILTRPLKGRNVQLIESPESGTLINEISGGELLGDKPTPATPPDPPASLTSGPVIFKKWTRAFEKFVLGSRMRSDAKGGLLLSETNARVPRFSGRRLPWLRNWADQMTKFAFATKPRKGIMRSKISLMPITHSGTIINAHPGVDTGGGPGDDGEPEEGDFEGDAEFEIAPDFDPSFDVVIDNPFGFTIVWVEFTDVSDAGRIYVYWGPQGVGVTTINFYEGDDLDGAINLPNGGARYHCSQHVPALGYIQLDYPDPGPSSLHYKIHYVKD